LRRALSSYRHAYGISRELPWYGRSFPCDAVQMADKKHGSGYRFDVIISTAPDSSIRAKFGALKRRSLVSRLQKSFAVFQDLIYDTLSFIALDSKAEQAELCWSSQEHCLSQGNCAAAAAAHLAAQFGIRHPIFLRLARRMEMNASICSHTGVLNQVLP
jgi:hypothetical protein